MKAIGELELRVEREARLLGRRRSPDLAGVLGAAASRDEAAASLEAPGLQRRPSAAPEPPAPLTPPARLGRAGGVPEETEAELRLAFGDR